MRGRWGWVPVVAGVVAIAPACGNNYSLVDPPTADASTSSSDANTVGDTSVGDQTGHDSGTDPPSSPDAGSAAFPPPCDPDFDPTKIDCGQTTGSRCGSGLAGYPTATDLIECDAAGKATCVRHCAQGCLDLSNNDLPDQCGHCLSNEQRWYCGKDVGFVAADADVLFRCTNGQLSTTTSAAQCGKTFCHTTCTRTSPPPLQGSCCQGTPDN